MTQSSFDAISIQKHNFKLGLRDVLELKKVVRSPELSTGTHLVRLDHVGTGHEGRS